jgi:hypothetical protein
MLYSEKDMHTPTQHTGEERRIHVAICGESIAWAAIEAILRKDPAIDVTWCLESEDWHRLLNIDLDVILFDATAPGSAKITSLLKRRPGLTMIHLDFESDRIVARLAREDTVTTVEDLAQVIRSHV